MAEKTKNTLKIVGLIIAAIAILANIVMPFVVLGKSNDIADNKEKYGKLEARIEKVECRQTETEKNQAVTTARYDEIIRRLDKIDAAVAK